eukprot:TRINITY_DN45444_c0_g1_i1.p1 TRINITY_DN45444_c0_g1~~TRINITY_DN45444_c0_g1_i1.p1  ORF type:complete len:156 (-),score=36.62 TRINITY_DN45444_c0_g1_i1:824-1252(-)
MKVAAFMKKADAAATVPVSATVGDVASRMVSAKVGSIVVIDGTRAAGIVTKSDIVAAYASGVPHDTAVSSVMATTLITCGVDTERDAAAELMTKAHKHHVVVVGASGEFVGIVSSLDIAQEVILDAKAFPYSREALTGFLSQ